MYLKAIVLLIVASFTFGLADAQEVKEEKAVTIKMVKEEDGNISLDTTIILDEDFDGDWSTVTDDEELLKKLEEMDIGLDLDGTQKVYMIKAPETSKKAYFYSVETDEDGEVTVEVESGSVGAQNVWVSEIDGDSTITIVLKSEDCKHKEGEHKVLMTKSMNVQISEEDGDSVITYTIMTDGKEGESEDVMIWHSDGNEEINHEFMVKEIEGDSAKIIIMTTGGDDEDIHVVKKKEIIIITEEHEHDCDHDHDKDKKKKKKKKDDD